MANIHRLRAHILGNPPSSRVTLNFPDGTVRRFYWANIGPGRYGWIDESRNDLSMPTHVRHMVRLSRQPGVTFEWGTYGA